MLLTTLSKSRNAGGDLVLVNIPEQLRQLLQITKLIEVFVECASDEEGIDKLS